MASRHHPVRRRVRKLNELPIAWRSCRTSIYLVFTTPTGAPLNGRVVLRAFQGKLTDAAVPKVRFHDLRHSCSSLLQAKGISPRVVQEQLGHSDLSMTLRYTKVLPELAEAAARRMEDILAGAEEPALPDDALGGGQAVH